MLIRPTFLRALRPLLILAIGAACAAAARGDDGRQLRVPLLPAYKQECGTCHTAYPAGLLGAESWQRLMTTLPQHFGTDASLDPASVRQLAGWLTAHAATGRRAEPPPQDRITRSAWFVREHREVPKEAWSRPSIRSASNCAACHARANEGEFDEHDIRIPR